MDSNPCILFIYSMHTWLCVDRCVHCIATAGCVAWFLLGTPVLNMFALLLSRRSSADELNGVVLCAYDVGARGSSEHRGWGQRAAADGWKSNQPGSDHRAGRWQPATHRLGRHMNAHTHSKQADILVCLCWPLNSEMCCVHAEHFQSIFWLVSVANSNIPYCSKPEAHNCT